MEPEAEDPRHRLKEVALLFLKLGAIGFGGPASHVALMQEEIVRRRRWVDRQTFLDLVGFVHLIPGPNSTELALHLGALRAGWRGLLVAGAAFILPAMLSVLVLAWAYLRYDARPEIDWVLAGVKPVVIALIVRAIGDLSRTAVKGTVTLSAGLLTLVLGLWNVDPLLLLFLVSAGVTAVQTAAGLRVGVFAPIPLVALTNVPGPAPFDLTSLFLVFLKFGSIVFGSGYVLLAFLRADLVLANAWITDRELLDAIAIGQLTPGPVFTTATFIGYLLAGVPGALVATAGIFLPSFVIVAATRSWLPRLRRWPVAAAFLDGANVASLSLMVLVTLELAGSAFDGPVSWAIGAGALLLLWFTRVNAAWLILAGATLGVGGALLS